jgi:hypothetical protein
MSSPSRATQLKYAAAGKCQGCGKRKPRTQTLCLRCAGKHAAATSNLKLRLMQEGLCTQCGENPLATVRCCRECQDKHNRRTAEKKRESRRLARKPLRETRQAQSRRPSR